jgi:hypothetical protein
MAQDFNKHGHTGFKPSADLSGVLCCKGAIMDQSFQGQIVASQAHNLASAGQSRTA